MIPGKVTKVTLLPLLDLAPAWLSKFRCGVLVATLGTSRL